MIESTIELIDSVGPWPEHALKDINNARIKLSEKGHFEITHVAPKIYLPKLIDHGLDCLFQKTDITYRQFFENNDLGKFTMEENREKDVVSVQFGTDTIQINGVKLDFNKNCDFCPNVFHIHYEATQLHDGRLVCVKCYAKVFDTVLHSLKGSTNNA